MCGQDIHTCAERSPETCLLCAADVRLVSFVRVCSTHSHARPAAGDAQIPTNDELDPNRESPEERERRERLQRLKHLKTAIIVFLASCAVYFFVSVLRG